MKINYANMPKGSSKLNFILRYYFNMIRTWYLFHIKFPHVKYKGFVRVMAYTRFAKGMKIEIGNNVQFGKYCSIASDVIFKNNILIAGRVCFVEKHDHEYQIPQTYIWNSKRGDSGISIIEDDVWLGNNVTIIGGVTIGKGAIVAAGAVVTKNIPPCEIWGGIPARKIKDRFENEKDKIDHLNFINQEYA